MVFIRELVPKRAVAAVARFAFGENYSWAPMSHRKEINADGGYMMQYGWGRGQERCSMEIETEARSFLPPDGSEGQFITEHYRGYSAQSGGGCLEYEVKHPAWRVRRAKRAAFMGNAAGFYGKDFAQMLLRDPDSAFLAEGSEVTVMKGRRIVRSTPPSIPNRH